MKNVLIFVTIFFIAFSGLSAQDTIVTGNYYGKNLYITNPSIKNTNNYCISKVVVNEKVLGDEIASNSFEIDFALYGVLINSAVNIVITYAEGCKIKIVNPEVLQAKSSFAFISAKVDKTSKLNWTVKGEIASSFIIDQFRWNKWMSIGEIDPADTVHKNMYALEIKPHFGPNLFRISHTDFNGNTVYSKPVKYRSATTKEVLIVSQKVTTQLDFSAETAYEIFDDKGNFISDGVAQNVDITDLPKGKYWVNYDNKSDVFSKK